MKIGRVISGIVKRIETRRLNREQAEINRYVHMPNLFELSETVKKPMTDVLRFRKYLAKIAKEDNVKFSMDVVEAQGAVPKLKIKMSPLKKLKSGLISVTRSLDIDDSRPLVYDKPNPRMLEDKDGVNYISHGFISTEDCFLARVYRTVGFLLQDLHR